MGATMSTTNKVSRVAPAGEVAQAEEKRAAPRAYSCCLFPQRRGRSADPDGADVEASPPVTFSSEGALQEIDECKEVRDRWDSNGSTALISEDRPRWGTDDTFLSEDGQGFDAEEIVLTFDSAPGASTEAGAASPWGVSKESAAGVGAACGAPAEVAGAMTPRAVSKESAASASTISGASAGAGAMTPRAVSKESAASASTISGEWAEAGAMTPRTARKESVASGASTEAGAATFEQEPEVVPDPIFRWALSGREIEVADLAASDSVEEAREKIAKAVGSSAKLLRLLGPDGRPLEDEGAVGAGGLVYGRDPDEVEKEELAAQKRAAHDAIAALLQGY